MKSLAHRCYMLGPLSESHQGTEPEVQYSGSGHNSLSFTTFEVDRSLQLNQKCHRITLKSGNACKSLGYAYHKYRNPLSTTSDLFSLFTVFKDLSKCRLQSFLFLRKPIVKHSFELTSTAVYTKIFLQLLISSIAINLLSCFKIFLSLW